MDIGKEFFAFVTLVAVLMVVIYALNKPTAISNVLNSFSSILGNLKTS